LHHCTSVERVTPGRALWHRVTRSHSLYNTVNLPTAQEKKIVKNIKVHYTPFIKQIHQSYCLWNAISTFDHIENSSIQFQHLVALTQILEEFIQLEPSAYLIVSSSLILIHLNPNLTSLFRHYPLRARRNHIKIP